MNHMQNHVIFFTLSGLQNCASLAFATPKNKMRMR